MDADGLCAGAMELCSDAARFASRADRFPFLAPEQIRDANRRRPDHPAYNPRTLHIPADWFKKANVSEGQRQWCAPMHAPFCSAAGKVERSLSTTGPDNMWGCAMRCMRGSMRTACFESRSCCCSLHDHLAGTSDAAQTCSSSCLLGLQVGVQSKALRLPPLLQDGAPAHSHVS